MFANAILFYASRNVESTEGIPASRDRIILRLLRETRGRSHAEAAKGRREKSLTCGGAGRGSGLVGS